MLTKLQIVMIASVALNAALLGVVGGRMLVKATPPTVVMPDPSQGPARPVSAEVQAAWAQLPEADRIELRSQFKDLGAETVSVTRRLRESAARIADIAHTEPFNRTDLQDQVVIYRHLQTGLQQRVDDTLIGHLEKMPPESRETAARGLLTPYYAWMRPARESPPGGRGPGPSPDPVSTPASVSAPGPSKPGE